ncbi:MAG: hypothetical protein ACYCY7_14185, partial [Gallionella sp.]
RQVRRLVWESAPGYALHRFPNKIEKADNSCATEPDNSKNPRHISIRRPWQVTSFGSTLQHIILLTCSKIVCPSGVKIPFTQNSGHPL